MLLPAATAGGGQNQSVEKEEEEDRISSLPDCLIIEILSRLPRTKYAIRTGVLSKRWKHLWTFVHTLIFRECEFHMNMRRGYSVPVLSSFIDNTIAQFQSKKLNKLEIHLTRFHVGFDRSQVNSLIRHAISCNVQELHLYSCNSRAKFELKDDTFFNSCCTHLDLTSCIFSPSGVISWNKLKSLLVSDVKLDEALIQNILSGSPLLETLNLEYCYGYKRLDITSKSVKNLIVSGYYEWTIFEINAPNVLSLTVQYAFDLRKILLLDVSSLLKADLNFTNNMEPYQEEMFQGLVFKLQHVKELKVGKSCSQVLSLLKAKGRLPRGLKYITTAIDRSKSD